MKTTLSKTINIEPATDIVLLIKAFEPIAQAFCLHLQSDGMVGRKLKIGVKDQGEWHGAEFPFITWQYEKLTSQIGGNLAVIIEWNTAEAIHLSVSDIVPKEEMPVLGSPDLVMNK